MICHCCKSVSSGEHPPPAIAEEVEVSVAVDGNVPEGSIPRIRHQEISGSGKMPPEVSSPTDSRIELSQTAHENTRHMSHSGWLLKKGSGKGVFGRRNWKRRFFRLEGHTLSYFTNARETKRPKDSVSIKGARILEIDIEDGAKYEFMFDLKLQKAEGDSFARVLHLRAENSSDLEAWVNVLD